MPYLSIFGVTIPVSDISTNPRSLIAGDRQKTFAGKQIIQTDKIAQASTIQTPVLTPSDLAFFEGFCEGSFEYFPLSVDTWGSNGRPWVAKTGAFATGEPFGVSNHWVGDLSYQTDIKTDYAIAFYGKDILTSNWDHYLIQSNGTNYKNGVVYVGVIDFITITNGLVAINSAGTLINGFRDLTIFAFVFPETQYLQFYQNHAVSNYMGDKLPLFTNGSFDFSALGFVSTRYLQSGFVGNAWQTTSGYLEITFVEA